MYERSRGNPYFSELLVRRGDLDSSELPGDLPDELSSALLDTWRGLSAPAREITRILAIAGRPTDLGSLDAVAGEIGVAITASVRESVDAGVVVLDGEMIWFRHPLLAGVLAESYLPREAAPVHAAWAAHLDSLSAEGVDELRRLGDLASHHERAGQGPAAFDVLLRGADLAEKLGAPREAADLLARAANLWEPGADATDTVDEARLLERAGNACLDVERTTDGYRLIRAARDLVSPNAHPVWAGQLEALVAKIAFNSGETQDRPRPAIERFVEVSRVEPDSLEHAKALAWHAITLFWEERHDQALQVLADAVAAAYRTGSAVAISTAQSIRAEIQVGTDLEQAVLAATVCWEQALASDDPDVMGAAYDTRVMVSYATGDLRRLHEHSRHQYEWSRAQGQTAYASVFLIEVLLAMGDLVEAEGIVRAGLAANGHPNSEAIIRLQAEVLAVRRGANDAAREHLARAQEIRPHLEERPECMAAAPMAEMLMAEDNPAGAFDLIERLLPINTIDPRVLDDLIVLGARAAADLVQRASDDRDQAAVQRHREALTRLMKARATMPGIAFQPSCSDDTVQAGRGALFAAEAGRAEGVDDQTGLWKDAVAACAAAGLGWEQQVSSWRLASALIESGGSLTEAAELLRGVHDYAVQQSATPLQTRVEELAASARISLTTPRIPTAVTVPAAFTGLTARETEVLAYLVANRTNAEIAEALFISEKTVSVHVSNLLRKTDTGSRREVSSLARRVGWGAGGQDAYGAPPP